MRIVTLLPSATEIVCALGGEQQLVGVSHGCNYPASVRRLPRMTSTHVPYEKDSRTIDAYVRDHLTGHAALYDLDLTALSAARPDVIVAQALCDVCAVSTGDVLAALHELPSKPTLIDLEPHTLNDVFTDIQRVAEALGYAAPVRSLMASLTDRRDAVARVSEGIASDERPRTLFLEWLLPPFCGGHWNPELVELAGGIDLLGNRGEASTTLSWEQILNAQPEVIFIACCGFDIDRARADLDEVSQRRDWQSLPAVVNGRVYLADGNAYFSSPGPRLIDGLEIMAKALHPRRYPGGDSGRCLAYKSPRFTD